jgi:RNA polymerase sigma factor (sigma-70 family)
MAVTQISVPAASRGEQELVSAARCGDDRAFEELYSRYHGRITAYVRGMVRDQGRAEDIMQEVFISALRRLRETDRPIAFKPWVYEIAKNACIDEHRRNQRAREVPFGAEEELPGPDVALRAVNPPPEEVLEGKQRLDALRGALGGLSDSHHKVLVMREFEGLSYGEIGDRLEMTRPMVESTLFRARRKLSEEYQELTSGRRCEQVQAAIDTAGPKALRSFGIRQRRQLARHVSHCQPCRHVALMAGWNPDELKPRSIAARVAALLPFPFLRWRRHDDSAAAGSSSPLAAHSALQSLAGIGEPLSSLGVGRAVAIAALALAGAGGGVAAISEHSSRPAPRFSPARAVSAPAGSMPMTMGGASTAKLSRISHMSLTSTSLQPRSTGNKRASARDHSSASGSTGASSVSAGAGTSGQSSSTGSSVPFSITKPSSSGSQGGDPQVPTKLPSGSPPSGLNLPTGGAGAPKSPNLSSGLPPVQSPSVPSLPSSAPSGSSTGQNTPVSKIKLPSLP